MGILVQGGEHADEVAMGFGRFRGIVLVAALAVLSTATACALRGSGYQYVRNRSTGTYFKVPSDWKVYGRSDLIHYLDDGTGSVKSLSQRLPYLATFDAADRPAIGRFFRIDTATEKPAGLVQVQALSNDEREGISISVLRSVVVQDFDTEFQNGQVKVTKYEDVKSKGNFRGKHMVFTKTTDSGGTVEIDQTTMLDQPTRRLYVLAIGCEVRCFEQNKKVIGAIVTSWTIKET